jgi:uncharacterized membrane protein YozB (DUF420 family)
LDYYLFIATVSLVIQLAVLALLLVGFELKRKMKLRFHGIVMLAALVAHLTVIFAVMAPSFVVALVPITLQNPASITGVLVPIHATMGSIAAVLGTWIVGSWRLRQSTEYCMPKKKIMRATFIVWLVSLSLGVLLYLALYWQLLFG